ncbi:MAG: TonB family protein [Saprospiraceae bacterium]|nr:TonB family protein [Saprospiraceae bacterium]MBP6569117.1 TonB family protein [Saprospiraceae bacterium]
MFKILKNSIIVIFLSCQTLSVCSQDVDGENEVFKIVEEMPRFPGCEHLSSSNEKEDCAKKQLMNYIYSHQTYSIDAILKHTAGQVVIQFIIEKDSSIKNIEITRDIGNGCGQAAVDVVESMNNMDKKWRPGYYKGKPVRVKYTLPVNFSEVYNFLDPNDNSVEYIPVFSDCNPSYSMEDAIKCNNLELKNYISDNLAYPVEAYNAGVEGVVQVGFIIEKDGSVSSIKIIHSLSDVCDRAALQVIQSMNDLEYGWEPAQLRERFVDYFYTFDIEFSLKKEKKRRLKK